MRKRMSKHDLAFPFRIDNGADEPTLHTGLTIRHYTAIHLAQGLLACPDDASRLGDQAVVQVAVAMADELLDELERTVSR
jgi:hypothetical protein